MKLTTLFIAGIIVLSVALSAQAPASPEALLKAAQQREQVDGDRAGALALYEALVQKHPKHPVSAEALLRIGTIYDSQGNASQARAAWTRIATDFASLTSLAKEANSRLGALATGIIDRRVDWPETTRMAGDLSFSPDGRYISYTDQRTRELAVRDLRTGAARQMTNMARQGGYVEYSAISNDGRFIAVVANEKGRTRRGLHLLPMTATDKTPTRLLVEGDWVAPRGWMPGDREIFVLIQRDRAPNDLALVRVNDGSIRALQRVPNAGLNSRFAVSPDGAFVATHGRAGTDSTQHDVYLVPTDGGPVKTIVSGPSNDTLVGWSPDSRYLVFLSNREGSRGKGIWALPMSKGEAAGAPVLLKADFPGGIVGMSASGALLYETSADGPWERTLFVATIDPQSGRVIEAPKSAAHDPSASNLWPRWSGDGKWFMYATERPERSVLSIRSPNGVTREVPRAFSYVWTFEVSPDGRWLAFRATKLGGSEGIYLMDAETGELKTVRLKDGKSAQAEGTGYYRPEFSLDGRKLYYARTAFSAPGKPAVMQELERDLETWEERIVAEPTRPERMSSMRSPDRKLILYLANQPNSTLSVQDDESAPIRVVFRGERPNAIDGNTDIRWMPDGRSLLVKASGKAPNERWFWWVPLDGRAPVRIELGRSDIVDTGIAVHPDGKQIAFVAGDPIVSKNSLLQTDFRILENFLPVSGKVRR